MALFAVVGLLGSCAGERPSLGQGVGTTTQSNTTTTAANANANASAGAGARASTSTSSPAVSAPTKLVPGPDTLLGYIATPVAAPVVRSEPRDDAPPIDIAPQTRAGAPTTFAVVGDPTTVATEWLEVLLPTRPNGAVAWVPRASVTLTKTPFRLFIDLQARSLRVEEDSEEAMVADIAVGTSQNPTPVGASYVTELIDNNAPAGTYGPYAFGLALHSDTLTEFAGGPGQVGIHGTNVPQLIGQRVSAGCIRLTNENVKQLVDLQLPLGVPVLIS